ncbi:MAG: tRNA (adenosine(37)-N6)-threonylcarbamoyltransferase complex dimerization subunit type 1 TsaB [Dehalococcoidales bacterium]|jgi:tRNA threonylcarbamoyl adenosine modification protein YeaZ|nr:tRNA (adenosine(37)-N6)-threonylcarbamoyltransferase complex dimerization subunit type 1 TsaB [Limnochordia bacterium]MDD4230394.1 tRNA (adenosine(37)-N6)-threonylcarbamoyltransferase complex dimerization subunit type 1 TsaB [Dehalococcoidales bacterium]MDD4465617.1 tRNA (adenosine(37)-N6)-threonylcarbamoyltransferase complex dimerization subunit type 1 TsaB [Dehalococcoidales bacterium]MDD5402099.1 tRNA (adenosine(37)-N6)-threonylcarbamoyltransferase complex dimerization subunit type 1 TsaB 
MLVLGIDTSTRYTSLALVDNMILRAENTWECRHNHSVELLPALDLLLSKAGLQIGDIQGIGAAIGPGGFNGLRVGLSIAKGIAYSLNVPIAGISSLEAIACQHATPDAFIVPVIQSGQDVLSSAFYKSITGRLELIKEPFLIKAEDLINAVPQNAIICGDMDQALKQVLAKGPGGKVVLPFCQDLPAYSTEVALLASERFKSCQVDDVHTLEPFYLKKPHITKPKNKVPIASSASIPSRAVIWDMDGVIVDSAEHHLQAWKEAFKPLAVDFEEEYFRHTFGTSNDSIVAGMNLNLSPEQAKAVISAKETLFRQMVSAGIEPLPGAIDLIIGLKKRKISMAIASSAPQDNIRCILKALGIRQYFRVLVGEEDITRGKPDPEVFLTAARKLGVDPGKCLVIEDALQGVSAAKQARMACLAVATSNPAVTLQEADFVVESLACINTDELLGLIK